MQPAGFNGQVARVGWTGNGQVSGAAIIAEYSGAGQLLRRYVHGPGVDEPLVWYDGADTSSRNHLYADERGSVIAVDGPSGGVNTYDAYGVPGASNVGLFQYTGQIWLQEAGLYHYKARAYDPFLGRFLQPDPIGYGDGMNMYAYVGGDPINRTDPTGMDAMIIDCRTQEGHYPVRMYGGDAIGGETPVSVDPSWAWEFGVIGYHCEVSYWADDAGSGGEDGGGSGVGGQLQGQCGAVPLGPPGVSLDANIAIAGAHNPHGKSVLLFPASRASAWFFSVVQPGGPWDYKTQNPPGTQKYTDFGNFNFGATGRAVGFSREELLWGAGIAQLATDVIKGRPIKGWGSRFDNLDDPPVITAGMDYTDNGCPR